MTSPFQSIFHNDVCVGEAALDLIPPFAEGNCRWFAEHYKTKERKNFPTLEDVITWFDEKEGTP